MIPVTVAWSTSDDNAKRYLLSVLCVTSRFHIMGQMGQNQSDDVMFVEFARWRHQCAAHTRGHVCYTWLLCFARFLQVSPYAVSFKSVGLLS